MTEREWQLSRELATLKIAFCDTQMAYMQLAKAAASKELEDMGNVWVVPSVDKPA